MDVFTTWLTVGCDGHRQSSPCQTADSHHDSRAWNSSQWPVIAPRIDSGCLLDILTRGSDRTRIDRVTITPVELTLLQPSYPQRFPQISGTFPHGRIGADGVICGHIHHATEKTIDGVAYLNCGDWVESCTALVEHFDGHFEIIRWTSPKDVAETVAVKEAAQAAA